MAGYTTVPCVRGTRWPNSTARRARALPSKDFGLPEKARSAAAKKETGNYPMPDRGHAISAKRLSREEPQGRQPHQGRVRADRPQGRQDPEVGLARASSAVARGELVGRRHVHAPADHALLDPVDRRLQHLHPGEALLLAGDDVPRARGGGRCARTSPRRRSGTRSPCAVAPVLLGDLPAPQWIVLPVLEPLQLLLGADLQPELDDDHALQALARSKLTISSYARPHWSSVAKPSMRSTSTRPYQLRSNTDIPPRPGT